MAVTKRNPSGTRWSMEEGCVVDARGVPVDEYSYGGPDPRVGFGEAPLKEAGKPCYDDTETMAGLVISSTGHKVIWPGVKAMHNKHYSTEYDAVAAKVYDEAFRNESKLKYTEEQMNEAITGSALNIIKRLVEVNLKHEFDYYKLVETIFTMQQQLEGTPHDTDEANPF